jgi:hypothetical protein
MVPGSRRRPTLTVSFPPELEWRMPGSARGAAAQARASARERLILQAPQGRVGMPATITSRPSQLVDKARSRDAVDRVVSSNRHSSFCFTKGVAAALRFCFVATAIVLFRTTTRQARDLRSPCFVERVQRLRAAEHPHILLLRNAVGDHQIRAGSSHAVIDTRRFTNLEARNVTKMSRDGHKLLPKMLSRFSGLQSPQLHVVMGTLNQGE